jgi:hypothetical protein
MRVSTILCLLRREESHSDDRGDIEQASDQERQTGRDVRQRASQHRSADMVNGHHEHIDRTRIRPHNNRQKCSVDL